MHLSCLTNSTDIFIICTHSLLFTFLFSAAYSSSPYANRLFRLLFAIFNLVASDIYLTIGLRFTIIAFTFMIVAFRWESRLILGLRRNRRIFICFFGKIVLFSSLNSIPSELSFLLLGITRMFVFSALIWSFRML